MINLDGKLKSRDITLPTKVYLVKAMVFPAVMFGCESWTIKRLSTAELMFLIFLLAVLIPACASSSLAC